MVVETDQVKRSPNWQNYLEQVTGMDQGPKSFFPAGTKTMRKQEDDSANTRHAASIAQADRSDQLNYRMNAEKNALQKWMFEQELAWEKESFYAARQAALDDGSRSSIFDWDAYNQALESNRPHYYNTNTGQISVGTPKWSSMDQYGQEKLLNAYNPMTGQPILHSASNLFFNTNDQQYQKALADRNKTVAERLALSTVGSATPPASTFNVLGHGNNSELDALLRSKFGR